MTYMTQKEAKTYSILASLAIGLLVLGTIFYHLIEGFSWVDAFYFSVITLTTVGYGDLSPHTDAGKLFTSGYVLFGVGIITTFISVFLKKERHKFHERHLKKQQEEPKSKR